MSMWNSMPMPRASRSKVLKVGSCSPASGRSALHRHRYEQIKALGADLIEDYELVYPLEPFEIADVLGVHVAIHNEGLPVTAQRFSTSDGYTEPVASRHGWKFRIHINGSTPGIRQRFTLMHELAHIWLDHLRADAILTDERAEGEANFLANYLLAPDALVVLWAPELTISAIAQAFRMSDEAAEIAHGRVLRAINRGTIGKPLDHRIATCATRRIDASVTELSVRLRLV